MRRPVRHLICSYWSESYAYSISSCISCVLQMICSEAGVHLVLVQPWGGLLIVYIVLFSKAV